MGALYWLACLPTYITATLLAILKVPLNSPPNFGNVAMVILVIKSWVGNYSNNCISLRVPSVQTAHTVSMGTPLQPDDHFPDPTTSSQGHLLSMSSNICSIDCKTVEAYHFFRVAMHITLPKIVSGTFKINHENIKEHQKLKIAKRRSTETYSS